MVSEVYKGQAFRRYLQRILALQQQCCTGYKLQRLPVARRALWRCCHIKIAVDAAGVSLTQAFAAAIGFLRPEAKLLYGNRNVG